MLMVFALPSTVGNVVVEHVPCVTQRRDKQAHMVLNVRSLANNHGEAVSLYTVTKLAVGGRALVKHVAPAFYN